MNTLKSPRFLRTLPWISGLVLFAGVIAFSIAYFGNTGKTYQITPTGGKAQVAKEQPTVKVDPKARVTAGKYIVTAMTRQDLPTSWKLTHPELRAGLTYKDWLTGNIPVQYFPPKAIAGATFKVDESHPREVMLDVLILAKPKAEVKSQAFFIGLKSVGKGKKKRWLVNYVAPHGGAAIVPNLGS